MPKVFIGTSGWQYSHWRGNFYPPDLPYKYWLKFYAKHFNTVEVNSSFYRHTRASTFEKWVSETPNDFVFSVKGNRFITHIKRLKDCEDLVEIFFENLKPLLATRAKSAAKHVVLWQLPPSLKAEKERLKEFIKFLPKSFRHAFEFRHPSWTTDTIKRNFKSLMLEFAVVLQDWKDWPIFEEAMGDFVYVRFHGKDQLYASGYSKEELAIWSEKMQKWMKEGKDVYAYFNNDALGYAVPNAQTLKSLMGL